MQSSLKVTPVKSDCTPRSARGDRFLVQHKSNLIKGLTAVVVILPQALVFAAASGIEPKAELYTAIVTGTVLTAWLMTRRLHRPRLQKNFTQSSVMSTIPK
ncbi:MAG TPA: hypothetical protein DCE56_09515 [Cyanobacteria bacterium UBA8553]|nr:hypothetical protein [Cyanobacteria bacterium UBA8553]